MTTAGIDLATTAAKTAVCVVDWSACGVQVEFRDDATDNGLIEVCRDDTVDKVGIDCPFGWRAPFVAAISAHLLGEAWPGREQRDPAAFRNTLALRLTDFMVKQTVPGAAPLAVAADRIGCGDDAVGGDAVRGRGDGADPGGAGADSESVGRRPHRARPGPS